jgi:hypothetical protein
LIAQFPAALLDIDYKSSFVKKPHPRWAGEAINTTTHYEKLIVDFFNGYRFSEAFIYQPLADQLANFNDVTSKGWLAAY